MQPVAAIGEAGPEKANRTRSKGAAAITAVDYSLESLVQHWTF